MKPPRAGLAVAAALAVLATAAGCGGPAGASADQPPARAIEAYVAALRADHPRDAYAMLSARIRRRLPYPAFERRWRASAIERRAQADQLLAALRARRDLGERARIAVAGGQTIALERQAGAWRLEAGLLAATHTATPVAAVELFADALARRRYDDLVRVLTARRRAALGDQVARFTASLRAQLADPRRRVELAGKDRAVLGWDDGDTHYRVDLRREDGEWRVDDVHVEPVPAAPRP